ncbi:MAG: glycosyltransferase family A protein [Ilumatobacteraceae bacterium]
MTVAIPTYNRSARLVAQLDRLAPDVVAEGGRCRVLVSDNCSTDDTADALARWVAAHPEVPITVRRNDANLGVMRNIAACARAADAEFVWILGDDDELPPGTLRRLLGLLEAHPDLTLLSVNYSMHDVAEDIEMTPARMMLRDDVVKTGPSPLTASDDRGVALVKMMLHVGAGVLPPRSAGRSARGRRSTTSTCRSSGAASAPHRGRRW